MEYANPMSNKAVMPEASAPACKPRRGKANQSAEASRFQRSYIALSCIFAVVFNEPRILYPVLAFTIITVLTSTRFDPVILFYRFVLAQIFGDLGKVSEGAEGKFLLGNAAEKFMFTILAVFVFGGLYLHHLGAGFWIVPVAVVAAGMSLAATTGICLMGIFFIQTRKMFSKSS